MSGVRFALAIAAGLALAACAAETGTAERRDVAPPSGEGTEEETQAAAPAPDPEDGRDDTAASCFAACQNLQFSCSATGETKETVTELVPEGKGCLGTWTSGRGTTSERSGALAVDCVERVVCVGDAPGAPATACVSGTFSAFSFAYTPEGGKKTVCTRS